MKDEVKKFKRELARSRKFNINQTAEIIGVSTRTIYTYLYGGKFPNAKKIGREWQIPEKDIRNYLK